MSTLSLPSQSPARRLRIPWLLVGGYCVASLDMLVAVAYWAPHGVAPSHILQSLASWVLGPAAYDGGLATACFGALLYAQVMWGVVSLYHALARRLPILLRRPLPCGAVFGIATYFALFEGLAPLLTGWRPDLGNTPWLLTCLASFALLVGMPTALFTRAARTSDPAPGETRR